MKQNSTGYNEGNFICIFIFKDVRMTIEPSGYYVPNRIARYVIVTLQDLMGENGLNAVLKQSGLPGYQ